VTEEG